jgi:small subunit ribosomal protein S15
MINAEKRQKIISDYRTHENDVGSSQIQIALQTERIRELTEHLKQNRKDHSTRRGLLKLVGSRSRHLRYLRRKDPKSYEDILQRLNIRR